MKDKAAREGKDNLYVMDGTLDSIPLPDGSLDVLITSNALGWNLQEELREIERVVKAGGHALHLLWSKEKVEHPFHPVLTSPPWNYSCVGDQKATPLKLRYSKAI
jgi:SAM-dependent methyltransferase